MVVSPAICAYCEQQQSQGCHTTSHHHIVSGNGVGRNVILSQQQVVNPMLLRFKILLPKWNNRSRRKDQKLKRMQPRSKMWMFPHCLLSIYSVSVQSGQLSSTLYSLINLIICLVSFVLLWFLTRKSEEISILSSLSWTTDWQRAGTVYRVQR